jgi:O-antigen ligase
LLALPLIMLGSRTGEGASSSTTERLESWSAALDLFIEHPLRGVGHAMFTGHHYLTAHNSYLLAAAEMGIVGLLLFVGLLYACGKTLGTALRFYPVGHAPPRRWATALLAAFGGLTVGMFFLSFTYHNVLWIFVGLCGAYYNVVQRAEEDFRIPLGRRDFAGIGGLALGVLVLLFAVTRLFPG